MSFFRELQGSKLAIPFTLYVNNLKATLQSIYSFCNITIPDYVVSNAVKLQNTTHNPTTYRPSYDHNFDRSLASLAIGEKKVKEQLFEYIEWIGTLDVCKRNN